MILGTLGTLGPLGASALLSDDRKRERAAKLLEEAGALVASGDVRSLGNIRRDLGLNSLELINLAVEIEEEFDVEIPDREAMDLETVN